MELTHPNLGRVLPVVLITATILAITLPVNACSSIFVMQASDMRNIQSLAASYYNEYGQYPVTDESGTWLKKLADAYFGGGLNIFSFGTTEDLKFPLDMYGYPIIYQPPTDPVNDMAIVRSVGENGIDDLGKLDDWDLRFEPNLGYWYKKGWPALYWRTGIWPVVFIILAVIVFRRSSQPMFAIGLTMFLGGIMAGFIIPGGYTVGLLGYSCGQTAPEWLYFLGIIGQLCFAFSILWFLILMSIYGLGLYIKSKTQRRHEQGLCLSCSYDLRGTIAAGHSHCPECGQTIEKDVVVRKI